MLDKEKSENAQTKLYISRVKSNHNGIMLKYLYIIPLCYNVKLVPGAKNKIFLE